MQTKGTFMSGFYILEGSKDRGNLDGKENLEEFQTMQSEESSR